MLIFAYCNYGLNYVLYSAFGTDFRRDCAELFRSKLTKHSISNDEQSKSEAFEKKKKKKKKKNAKIHLSASPLQRAMERHIIFGMSIIFSMTSLTVARLRMTVLH